MSYYLGISKGVSGFVSSPERNFGTETISLIDASLSQSQYNIHTVEIRFFKYTSGCKPWSRLFAGVEQTMPCASSGNSKIVKFVVRDLTRGSCVS